MDDTYTLDAERQRLLDMRTPPHVIDMLFRERSARIAAEKKLKDAERQISKERYNRTIKHSCRNDWLTGIQNLYGWQLVFAITDLANSSRTKTNCFKTKGWSTERWCQRCRYRKPAERKTVIVSEHSAKFLWRKAETFSSEKRWWWTEDSILYCCENATWHYLPSRSSASLGQKGSLWMTLKSSWLVI